MSPRTGVSTLMTATINGQPGWEAELDIQQDITYVRSETAVKPDPTWAYTDPSGHYHAWSGRALPTLRAETFDVPCDGSCGHEDPSECEGFTMTFHRCQVCDARVEPKVIPDMQARTVGEPIEGLRSWTVRLRGTGSGPVPALNDRVSVVLRSGGAVRFGFAALVSYEMTGDGDSQTLTTLELVGAGELGERKAT